MKNLNVLLLFTLLYYGSFGQYSTVQPIGSPTTLTDVGGALRTGKGVVNAIYADTATANLDVIKTYPWAQIIAGSALYIRNATATKWLSGGTVVGVNSHLFLDSIQGNYALKSWRTIISGPDTTLKFLSYIPGNNITIDRVFNLDGTATDSATVSATIGPPHKTTSERNAMVSPAEGTLIYNVTTHKLNIFTTVWEQVTSL